MMSMYQNDSVIAAYERARLNPDVLNTYDSRERHSLKERIKALEAFIEAYEESDHLDDDQKRELESSREELHDLRVKFYNNYE